MDRILNRPMAAKFLTISLSTLDRLLADKGAALPFKKLNVGKTSRLLFSQAELTWWVVQHEQSTEDPKVLEEAAALLMEDREDTKKLPKLLEQLQAVIKNLMIITEQNLDAGIEESKPDDILKKQHNEIVALSDQIKVVEDRLYSRAQKRFNLEREQKKTELKIRPTHEHYMSRDPRLDTK